MKSPSKKFLLVAGLTVPLCAALAQATFADNSATAQFIDKEFETSLRKFFTRRFCNRIDATAEQREKIGALFASTQDETRASREEFRHGLSDLSALVASEKATDDQITAKVQELRAMHNKIQDKRVNTVLALRKILTVEQREKVNNKIQDLLSGGAIKPRRLGMMLDVVTD